MKYTHINTLAAIAGLALTATSANAALLAVDFGKSTSPVATTFQQATAGVTTLGDFTINSSGGNGDYDRGIPSGANQIDDLYRDFIFSQGTSITIAISGVGIAADTEYELTFYAYDSGEPRRTAVAGTAGTTGTKLEGFGGSTTAPTTLDQYALTGTFTSDSTGNLTFLVDGSGPAPGTAGRSAINGFEISAVPEPSTTALLGLGGLALILRRRK